MRNILFATVFLTVFSFKNVLADEVYSEIENFSQIQGSYIDHFSIKSQKMSKMHYSTKTSKVFSSAPKSAVTTREKVIIVDPKKHVWAAYSADGKLLRSGLATTGAKWCEDIGRACKTSAGSFRIYSQGDSSCVSKKFPLGKGGAPMPYCMFFNGGQGFHGSNALSPAHLSHGCVRIGVNDAKWLRYNFATIGTKVIVKPY